MRRTTLLLILPLVLACGDGGTLPDGYIPDDGWSGDIVVVPGEDIESADPVHLVEELRVGTLDGPEESRFFRVMEIDVADGQLWILNGGSEEVRVLDLADGTLVQRFGGRGEGPGKFFNSNRLDVHGDTVFVLDVRRAHFFDRRGEILRSVVATARTATSAVPPPRRAGNRWFRAASNRGPDPADHGPVEEFYRDTVDVFATDPTIPELGTPIFRYPSAVRWRFPGDPPYVATPLFASQPVLRGGADGNLYMTPGDEYRIDIVDASTGDPIRRVVGAIQLPPVSREMVDAQRRADEELLASAPQGPQLDQAWADRRRLYTIPLPEARTILGSIRVADDGRFMVRRDDLDPDPLDGGDSARWDLFDADGRIDGRLETAPGVRVRHFTGDRIVTVETDEMDVEQVVVYRLEIR